MDKRRYSDRRNYLIAAVKLRRQKVRRMAIEYKGGKCERCSYQRCLDALEFHHLDSSKKDFGISDRGYTRSWKRIREEIEKCILLCANCHREIHAQTQLLVERRDEKSGEFREALISSRVVGVKGNPERSLAKRIRVARNVQRLGDEKRIDKPHSARHPNVTSRG